MIIEHGGALDRAIARFGGGRSDWLDLSTGINPEAFPLPEIAPEVWNRLPDEALLNQALQAARAYYGVAKGASIVAAPGTQALIQIVPELSEPGEVAILSPTYQEHHAAFARTGWAVVPCADIGSVPATAKAVVVVNPNNPDGRVVPGGELLALAERLGRRGGFLVVDEAFADAHPEVSVAGGASYIKTEGSRPGSPLWPAGHLLLKEGDYAFIGVRHQPQTLQDEGGRSRQPISPLEGEMPGRAEGGVSRSHSNKDHSNIGNGNLIILKSFGKFFGLAGVRLGFAISGAGIAGKLAARLGPWAVSGPALAIAIHAFQAGSELEAFRQRVFARRARLSAIFKRTGIEEIGGTALFALIRHRQAHALHEELCRRRILVRKFDYARDWLRIGLAAEEAEFERLEQAFKNIGS